MRTLGTSTLGAVLSLLLASPVGAVDGVLEINQTCAVTTGCFAGDAAGFPVEISASGSYRLTSNLSVSADGVDGIKIQTTDVAVDLNGFSVIGPGTCTGAGSGISCSGGATASAIDAISQDRITVRNGSARGFKDFGVVARDHVRVESMRIVQNGAGGISINSWSLVHSCIVDQNSGHGIKTGLSSVITDSQSSRNRLRGIVGTDGVTIRGCAARENGQNGIVTGANGTVSQNSVLFNERDGIVAGVASSISGNSVSINGNSTSDDQIECTTACQVTQNAIFAHAGTGYCLNFTSATAGYAHNSIVANVAALGTVNNGTDQGGNACNGSTTCP